jgi:hypothetical protein
MIPNVEVFIDELVLHGFAPGDRFDIGDVVEHELARLIREHDMSSLSVNAVALERLDGGAFNVNSGSKAFTIGNQIAQAVHRGLISAARATARSAALPREKGVLDQ